MNSPGHKNSISFKTILANKIRPYNIHTDAAKTGTRARNKRPLGREIYVPYKQIRNQFSRNCLRAE